MAGFAGPARGFRYWPPGSEGKREKTLISKTPGRGHALDSMPRRRVEPGLDGIVKVLWTVPKTPPSLNQWQSMHWGAQKRTKDAWGEYIFGLMAVQGLPMNAEWVYASAQIIFRKGAHRDLTNYEATFWKIFPDVLQRVGVLADDTEQEMRTGKVALIVDKTLAGLSSDPRLLGITRIAVMAKVKDDQ